jgi:hypothetical protein
MILWLIWKQVVTRKVLLISECMCREKYFNPALVYDHLGEILSTLVITSFFFCCFLYTKVCDLFFFPSSGFSCIISPTSWCSQFATSVFCLCLVLIIAGPHNSFIIRLGFFREHLGGLLLGNIKSLCHIFFQLVWSNFHA